MSFWKLGPAAAVVGALMIIGWIVLMATGAAASVGGVHLLLVLGLALLIGGISGGIWVSRSRST
jgi:predicted phage tail protein